MGRLAWDEIGERQYEVGVSKVVFYGTDRRGIVWNGVTSVQVSSGSETTPLYFDGAKYEDLVTVGDTEGTLKAFTYPDEFVEYEGAVEDVPGFVVMNQGPKRFSLCYRTEAGNDVDGTAFYKIHILYNLTAIPADTEFPTINDGLDPVEFEWKLTSIPEQIGNYRPTSHVVLDSRKLDPYLLSDVEDILYGDASDEGGHFVVNDNGDGTWTAVSNELDVILVDDEGGFSITSPYAEYVDGSDTDYTLTSSPSQDATLPSLKGLSSFITKWGRFVVNDNGDGTWTAFSSLPGVIEMLDEDTFQITTDTAAYVDTDETKYTITSAAKNESDLLL